MNAFVSSIVFLTAKASPTCPEIESHFALSEDGWWGGVAEPGGPPAPPAVANAIFFATGKRIRSTPISQHDLSWSGSS